MVLHSMNCEKKVHFDTNIKLASKVLRKREVFLNPAQRGESESATLALQSQGIKKNNKKGYINFRPKKKILKPSTLYPLPPPLGYAKQNPNKT